MGCDMALPNLAMPHHSLIPPPLTLDSVSKSPELPLCSNPCPPLSLTPAEWEDDSYSSNPVQDPWSPSKKPGAEWEDDSYSPKPVQDLWSPSTLPSYWPQQSLPSPNSVAPTPEMCLVLAPSESIMTAVPAPCSLTRQAHIPVDAPARRAPARAPTLLLEAVLPAPKLRLENMLPAPKLQPGPMVSRNISAAPMQSPLSAVQDTAACQPSPTFSVPISIERSLPVAPGPIPSKPTLGRSRFNTCPGSMPQEPVAACSARSPLPLTSFAPSFDRLAEDFVESNLDRLAEDFLGGRHV